MSAALGAFRVMALNSVEDEFEQKLRRSMEELTRISARKSGSKT